MSLPISNRTVQVTLPGVSPSKTYTAYNGNGLPTETDEYDYGPTLVRRTTVSYTGCGVGNPNVVDRPCLVQVYDGQNNLKAQTSKMYNANGNLTQAQYTTQGTSTISRSFTYNSNGTAATSTDFNGNQTTYNYNGTGGCASALPTSITQPLSLTQSMAWDCNGGVVTSVTDANHQTTNFSGYDDFWRLLLTNFPDGGQTQVTYYDSPPSSVVTTTKLTSSTNRADTVAIDGQGRPTETELNSDPAGTDYVRTIYDSLGRVGQTSNPFRSTSDPTYGWTNYSYDALSRVTKVMYPDSNFTSATYSGNCATSTDPAGKARKICTDALGRVTQVFEDPSGLNYETDYQYDALNNLTKVTQGGQTRTYQYDMLSRLTSVTAPESGTTNFFYTTSGGGLCSGDPNAVCRRTDARGVTTTYTYDALNRLTQKSYSDGTPTASFFYDEASVTLGSWSSPTLQNTAGRLTHTTVLSGSTLQAATVEDYDKMGRPADFWQCAPFDCSNSVLPPSQYTYDLAGDVVNYLTPSNGDFHITTTINAAQQVTEMDGNQIDNYHPKVLGQFTYTPFGALSQITDGCTGTGCAGYIEAYAYNNRLQPVMIELGTTSNPTSLSCWAYNYYTSVTNPTACVTPTEGTGNNGNVAGDFYLDNLNTRGHTSGYTYDSLNRLATAVATGNSTYNLTFVYNQDGSGRYGNMSCQVNGQGLCATVSFDAATNRISTPGYSYDAAGNLTSDGTGVGSHTYQWDGDGRLKSATVNGGSTVSYVYNALGQQVDSVAAGPVYRETYYDAFGAPAVSQNHTTTLEDFFPPVAGRNYVKFALGGTLFLHTTVQGTTGIVTAQDNSAWQDQVYYPLGQQWIPLNGGYDVRFGSMQERDAVTGLDPTPARQYNSTLGRWMSPDPLAGDISNPQSLNRYAYALNNPTTLIDPLGLDGCVPGAECVTVYGGMPPDLGFAVSQGLATLCYYSGYGCGYGGGSQNYAYSGGGGGGAGSGSSTPTQKPTPPNKSPKPPQPCRTTGFGAGLTGGLAADAGVIAAGAAANGSVSGGLFHNSQTSFFVGGVASGGATAYVPGHTAGVPQQGPGLVDRFAVGAFAGVGGGLFFTNAGSAAQLAKTTTALSIDFGFGPAASIQVSGGNGITSFSITGGVGAGFAITVLNTASKPTGGPCG